MQKTFSQTTQTVTKLMDGRLRIEQRNGAPMFYARAYFQGKNRIFRTGETELRLARTIATEWYLDLRQRVGRSEKLDEPLFADVAEDFLTDAERRKRVGVEQRASYKFKWSALKPFFSGVKITQVDTPFMERLREQRSSRLSSRKALLKPATLKKDLMFVSLVLRHAKANGHIEKLPDIPAFTGPAFQIVPAPRPFLDPEQYRLVQKLAKQRADYPDNPPRVRRQRQETYWFLLLCVGAALRVGEAYSLRWCDCELVELEQRDGSWETAVKLEVLGKHSKGGQRELGYGFYGAVHAFKEMRKERPEAKPEDPLFEEHHRDGINELFTAAGVRTDPKTGRTRDTKSLRPTGISLRLELGDNISYRDVAKWSRTSVAMVEQFYDQTHPENSAARVMGFRTRPIKTSKTRTSKTKRGKTPTRKKRIAPLVE